MKYLIVALVPCLAFIFSQTQSYAAPTVKVFFQPAFGGISPDPSPTSPSPTLSASASTPILVPPKQLNHPPVVYPANATGSASILLEIRIDEKGKVTEVKVLDGIEPFSEVAKTAGFTWEFEPALRNGIPIKSTIRAQVIFTPPPPATSTSTDTSTSTSTSASTSPSTQVITKQTNVQTLEVMGRKKEIATTSLSQAEIRTLPGAFGDPFRIVEALPGVVPILSGLPFFFVRGAPPSNTGYFLDGMRLPMLYHLGVGPAIASPAMIDQMRFFRGGSPAAYGRTTGGVMAGETFGAATRLRGEYNLRLFDAGLMVETPFDNGKGDVTVGGRYGYAGPLLKLFASNLGLQYWDYQVRGGYRITERDRLSVFFLGSFDELKNRDKVLFGAEFHRVDVRWDHRFDKGQLRVAVTGMHDQTVGGDSTSAASFDSSMKGIALRAEGNWLFSDQVQARYGADLIFEDFDLSSSLKSSAGNLINKSFQPRLDTSTSVRGDIVLKPTSFLEIVPGLRFDVYGQLGTWHWALDPRLSVKAKLDKSISWISTIARGSQWPTFVVPGPGLRPATLNSGLQQVSQFSQGIEMRLPLKLELTTTAFYSSFQNMNDMLQTCSSLIDPSAIAGYDPCADFETRMDGRAYGVEFLLRRPATERISGWISYTLSKMERVYYGIRTSDFDRTHVFNAALSYNLGDNWRAGLRFTFLSGRPITLARIPNSPQLKALDFARLDLRLEKRWTLGPTSWITGVVEMFNTFFRPEVNNWKCNSDGVLVELAQKRIPDFYNYCEPAYIGPIAIPSIGIEGGF